MKIVCKIESAGMSRLPSMFFLSSQAQNPYWKGNINYSHKFHVWAGGQQRFLFPKRGLLLHNLQAEGEAVNCRIKEERQGGKVRNEKGSDSRKAGSN